MTPDPFAELRQAASSWGLRLDDGQVDQLRRYGRAVLVFNRKANLTAAEDEETVALRHIADGLACVPVLKGLSGDPAPAVLDVGSGAGFIGLAVKVAWPEARVTLMEPRLKRYGFLSATAALLRLSDIGLLRRRAEDRREGRDDRYDFVVARALAPLEEALAVSLPWAKEGGHVVVYQSIPPDPGSSALAAALSSSGAGWGGARPYRLPRESGDRFLALFSKKGDH
ncbi:MAG: 16S rRNA (guanine(527)-N(7))-methyltransferase RsmG [Elusimicrobia bacterium]|nr:16S rRNA (guanine(527)-N(7))-methyltransferase RsmG [Elusimicrobiota bacterium]